MRYEITRRSISPSHLAVARERRRWTELGGQLIPLLDRVYAAVRAGMVTQPGHNVFLYGDGSSDGVTVETGVEVASPFTGLEGVSYSSTRRGGVASAVHVGPYSGLGVRTRRSSAGVSNTA